DGSWASPGSGVSGGSAGYAAVFSSATALTYDTALYVDTTNHRVGIGTSAPTAKFQVYGGGDGTAYLLFGGSGTGYTGASGPVLEMTGYYGTGYSPYGILVDNSSVFAIQGKTSSNRVTYDNSKLSAPSFYSNSSGAYAPAFALDLTSTHEAGLFLPAANTIG